MDAVKHAHDGNLSLNPAACLVRLAERIFSGEFSIDYFLIFEC
jgi:hypothetical protein